MAIEADSSASKRAAVLNQLGIALMFKVIIQHDLASGELVELEVPGGQLYGKRSLIYHRSRALPPPAKEFLTLSASRSPKSKSNAHEYQPVHQPTIANRRLGPGTVPGTFTRPELPFPSAR